MRNLDRMLETQFRLDVVFELSLPNFLFCVCLILAALVELGHETWSGLRCNEHACESQPMPLSRRITEIYFVEVREEAEMAWRHSFRNQTFLCAVDRSSWQGCALIRID